jgi:hypothetical protein
METYSGKINDDLDVTGEMTISGQTNGNVTVHKRARLRISGQTNGTVLVLEGGSVIQSGQLNGALICRGWADISGQINGRVVVEGGVVLVAQGVHRNTKDLHLILDPSGHWTPNPIGTITRITDETPRWRWNQDGSMSLVGPSN